MKIWIVLWSLVMAVTIHDVSVAGWLAPSIYYIPGSSSSECAVDDDCYYYLVCTSGRCKDPCQVCGPNTICKVSDHAAVCVCEYGHVGDPLQGCQDPDPPDPTTERQRECEDNTGCDTDRTCVFFRCVDPCQKACGNNTTCQVSQHTAVCSCKDGYVGDALLGCQKQDYPVTNIGATVNTVENKKKKYYVEKSLKLNWFHAYLYCRIRNRRLAVIESQDDNDNIMEAIDATFPGLPDGGIYIFWLAGTNLGHEGLWSWMSSGRPILNYMDYTNWNNGEPNNLGGNEHCLEYRKINNTFKWNDRTCSDKILFVCEYLE